MQTQTITITQSTNEDIARAYDLWDRGVLGLHAFREAIDRLDNINQMAEQIETLAAQIGDECETVPDLYGSLTPIHARRDRRSA